MSKKRLVIANWKMYLESSKEAVHFARTLRKKARTFRGVGVVLAPSFPLIVPVAEALKGSAIETGAQAVTGFSDAQHTGEVSAKLLKNSGASHVIVGHSERRSMGGVSDTDESIRAQLWQALEAGLTVVLCVGEKERTQDGAYFAEIERELSTALIGVRSGAQRLIIAYEPVWAIGKSAHDAMDPETLTEMVIFIRKVLANTIERKAALSVPILYGGSVESSNAAELITQSGINGFLVGHASASLESLVPIIEACRRP